VLHRLVGKQAQNGHGDRRHTPAASGRARALSARSILHTIDHVEQTHRRTPWSPRPEKYYGAPARVTSRRFATGNRYIKSSRSIDSKTKHREARMTFDNARKAGANKTKNFFALCWMAAAIFSFAIGAHAADAGLDTMHRQLDNISATFDQAESK